MHTEEKTTDGTDYTDSRATKVQKECSREGVRTQRRNYATEGTENTESPQSTLASQVHNCDLL